MITISDMGTVLYSAPLDEALRVRDPSPAVRILQHARQLEIAREQGHTDEAIHQLNLMLRLYHEHFPKETGLLAHGRTVRGFLPWPYDSARAGNSEG